MRMPVVYIEARSRTTVRQIATLNTQYLVCHLTISSPLATSQKAPTGKGKEKVKGNEKKKKKNRSN